MKMLAKTDMSEYQYKLVHLRRSDILINEKYLKLFIEGSKTDIYRDGAWVYVSRTFTKTCPVAALERYLDIVHMSCHSELFYSGFLKRLQFWLQVA